MLVHEDILDGPLIRYVQVVRVGIDVLALIYHQVHLLRIPPLDGAIYHHETGAQTNEMILL